MKRGLMVKMNNLMWNLQKKNFLVKGMLVLIQNCKNKYFQTYPLLRHFAAEWF